MNHYKSEDFKGKKAIHFTVSSRQQKGERGRETQPLGVAVFQAGERWFRMSAFLPYCVAFFTKRVRPLTAGILPEGVGT